MGSRVVPFWSFSSIVVIPKRKGTTMEPMGRLSLLFFESGYARLQSLATFRLWGFSRGAPRMQ